MWCACVSEYAFLKSACTLLTNICIECVVGGKRAFSWTFGSHVRSGKSRRYLWARSRGRGCNGLMLLGEIFVLNNYLVCVLLLSIPSLQLDARGLLLR